MIAKALSTSRVMEEVRTRKEIDKLLENSRQDLRRIALSITGNHESAEDATQDALLRASKSGQLSFVLDARSWLRRIVVRCAIDRLSSRTEAPLDEAPQGCSDPTEFLAVQQVLERLSVEHRTVLALALGQGFSYREIAETLDIPEGTVGSRLNAARAAFQREWDL